MIDFRCPVNGVLDQSLCAKGAPIAMSLPHFLYANESYIQHVEGLKPEIEKHQFYFDIEPVNIILLFSLIFTITFNSDNRITIASILSISLLFFLLFQMKFKVLYFTKLNIKFKEIFSLNDNFELINYEIYTLALRL